ncbi:NAD(P)-dependent alcohol dehydrogenase [Allonocardiopsis opalescens]|uniref:NADPH:quinone reductase-like Zn-dependent oxidoreductase n=1 Tax=Allonocardiopsis opalescens TaxID=1144618 RepID=A0A2T0Q798_9ACTN|nr:NAD(P)-dependent alcohol dehydrogenase [Allonocardiopsis opalescens]PRX99593.1 NADPH:quinone reductase-like Zn-dependent oxidoreductase [Allonocardiopsis opalescens]
MRAAVVDRYGPPGVVRVVEVPEPVHRADEILVRVRAAAVTAGDARIRGARFPKGLGPFARLGLGVLRPRQRILGSAFSGVVESVGAQSGISASGVAPGDEVCGMSGSRLGAHAEYVAVPAGRVVRKPAGVSHEDAAGVLFGGTTALYFLRDKAGLAAGMSVLVNGASGAVGTNAVQLAKHVGATVTAVTSTGNVPLVARLGADHVIDYTTASIGAVADRFDVVIDTVGAISPASGRRLLTPDGVLLLVAANLWEMLRSRGSVKTGSAPERAADIEHLLALMADGRLATVTDRVLALAEIVAAYERVDSGRKVGNVIIRL